MFFFFSLPQFQNQDLQDGLAPTCQRLPRRLPAASPLMRVLLLQPGDQEVRPVQVGGEGEDRQEVGGGHRVLLKKEQTK